MVCIETYARVSFTKEPVDEQLFTGMLTVDNSGVLFLLPGELEPSETGKD